jgi:hypothetical protein
LNSFGTAKPRLEIEHSRLPKAMSDRRNVGATPLHDHSGPRRSITVATPSPKLTSPNAASVMSRVCTVSAGEATPPTAIRMR